MLDVFVFLIAYVFWLVHEEGIGLPFDDGNDDDDNDLICEDLTRFIERNTVHKHMYM